MEVTHGMISIMMGLKNREKLCIIHGVTKSWVGGVSHVWDDHHNDGHEKS